MPEYYRELNGQFQCKNRLELEEANLGQRWELGNIALRKVIEPQLTAGLIR